MQVLNIIGGGKKLPTLSNPATAAQILAGYQAINGAGEILSGTYVPYYVNTASEKFFSFEEGNDQTITCTATGSEIVLAVVYVSDLKGKNMSGVGTTLGITSTRIGFGSYNSSISYSGQTVTVNITGSDVVGGITWYIWVLSK